MLCQNEITIIASACSLADCIATDAASVPTIAGKIVTIKLARQMVSLSRPGMVMPSLRDIKEGVEMYRAFQQVNSTI